MIPAVIDELIDRALKHQKEGRLQRAELVYRALVRRGHQSARLLTNLGVVCYLTDRYIEAVSLFEQALFIDPSYKDAWHNLVVISDNHSDYNIHLIADEIAKLFPGAKESRIASAKSYLTSGKPDLAESILQGLLADLPDDFEVLENICRCKLQLGDLDSATSYLLYILSLNPGDPFAAIELAEIAIKAGDPDSALQILSSALENKPDSHEILFQLGRFYQSCGKLSEAINFYIKSLGCAPASGAIIANLAYCYAETGQVDKFLVYYDSLLKQDLASPANLMPLAFTCSTLGLPFLRRLRESSELIWSLRKSTQSHSSLHGIGIQSIDHSKSICSPLSSNKKRVCILTGDLGIHVVSTFLASFLLNYSKDILEVEVVSNRWRNDDVAERLSSAVDYCVSIADLNEKSSRSLLKSRQYDVIIETSGFTSGTAIYMLDQRCAPVQCHWIGYHASTYLPTMDYFIGDSIFTPNYLCNQFSESIATLPRAWLASTPFTAIPEAVCKHPDDEIVIGSFSQIAKLTKDTLSMWGEVLAQAPRVKLMLKDKFVGDEKIQGKIISFMSDLGISNERILFQPRTADWFHHMTLYNCLDLALDTTPWSSATTAFDALSMGIPLISLLGETAAGRMSSSVLHHCGRSEWIASSPSEFVTKCISIIEEIHIHRRHRRLYQSEVLRSQLYDGPHLSRAIENFVMST